MPNVHEPLVLFAVERFGWCFSNIAQAIQRTELGQIYRFKTMKTAQIARETCDILVCFWWDHTLRVKANVRARAVVTCLYDELSWHINDAARAQFKLVLKNSDVIACCNEHIASELKRHYGALVPEIALIEDGVDTDLFQPTRLPDTFRVGWTGNSSRHTPGGPQDHKGLQLIRGAVELSGAELHILDAATGGAWPLQEMPKFYDRLSAVVLASACEGTPNPLLEGMAMGRPVLCTDVGIASKVIRDGKNGYLIERNVESIARAIQSLQSMGRMQLEAMGREARKTAMQWSWAKKARQWGGIFKSALRTASSPPGLRTPAGPVASRVQSASPVQVFAPVEVKPADSPKARRAPHSPPKVLAISDVRDWAFHQNMRDMEESLAGSFQTDHWFVAEWQSGGAVPDFEDYDAVFCVYHRWNINHLLPWDRTVGSLRALWFWPETPAPPGEREFALVNLYRAFHVVTKQNYEELRERCPNVFYLTNPVNMKRFPEPTPVEGEVIASWNGNGRHQSAGGKDVKGFWPIIVPTIEALKFPFEHCEYHSKRLPPAEMPDFYSRANLSICMSLYEGASNSTLEAMAAGQALVSTDVGNVREMQKAQLEDFGDTGIEIIERTPQALGEALQRLAKDPEKVTAMGLLNREEIIRRWSWDVWAPKYKAFLQKAMT